MEEEKKEETDSQKEEEKPPEEEKLPEEKKKPADKDKAVDKSKPVEKGKKAADEKTVEEEVMFKSMDDNLSEKDENDEDLFWQSKVDKMAFDDSTFNTMEQEFQAVLQELASNKTLDKFRGEYDKLHQALKKSHENEKRLMLKCRELNAEMIAQGAKVSHLMILSEEDQTNIASLKKEVEKAWKLVDQNQEKELTYKETIDGLKNEIENISSTLDRGSALDVNEEQKMQEIFRLKEAHEIEREELVYQISNLQSELSDVSETRKILEERIVETEEKITELTHDIQVKISESQRETRKKDKLEREMKLTKEDLETVTNELKRIQYLKDKYKEEITEKENSLEEMKVHLERNVRDNKVLETKLHKLDSDFKNQLEVGEQLNQELVFKNQELKQKEDEVAILKRECERLNKNKDTISRKLKALEDTKVEGEKEKEMLKSQINVLEKAIETSKKNSEKEKKDLEALTKNRDLINKDLRKAISLKEEHVNQVKALEQNKKNLEQEISNHKDEAQKQRKLIYQLEKERDRYINEASDLTHKVLQLMEEVKMREMQIFDFKKKIAEAETKLKQQQNLYEAVRSDRNLYSKHLIECQDEITEKKRKLKIMNHQIDQLKEEIQSKETALVQEQTARARVEKEKSALKIELQNMKIKANETEAYINTQESEKIKLKKIIRDADVERCRQKKELDQVISERDILGTQLVRRNDELALLFEKIKIQQSTLSKGEVQYDQRLEDIRVLKLEIKKLRREKIILEKSVANVNDLRQEVYDTQKELLRERTRCKALEEELENPLNIHRWRKLESSDPTMYKMIQRTHTLQKRLIKKTEEVVEKELLIQEKEKLYIELKHILARQPGPEVAEQLSIYQQTFKSKVKQMKVMASELTMYESQASEDKYEKERLARELQEVKKKYFLQKKKEEQQKEREHTLAQSGLPSIYPHKQTGSRYTGGGFNLRPPDKTAA
ncbi:cilia- and flagella-associated protein 58-like [Octopus sinensis]|uniref:Cilia- and flagella-associated protein 58-like n=1 Tax=Octopus sinensis TaxID=2607531 RepID=A0A6P7T6I1_9MOLL|nr:cilia- and flagella-associated protein 58-like [Octopus sinensis]